MQSSIQNFFYGQQDISQRKTKKQKLLQAKSVYICECTKIYLSFPALYLHVKNKHDVKLTSRIDEQACSIEEKNGKSYFTFFYSPTTQKKKEQQDFKFPKKFTNDESCGKYGSQNSGLIVNIKNEELESFETQKESQKKKFNSDVYRVERLVQSYLQSPKAVNCDFWNEANTLLLKFIEYIEKSVGISKQFERIKENQPKVLAQSLPLLFNQYLFYYLSENKWDQNYLPIDKTRQIQVMKMFGNWLREQNFTNLIVLDNL